MKITTHFSVIRFVMPTLTLALVMTTAGIARGGSGNLLIVTADTYVGSAPLNEYIAAKTSQGFDTAVYSVPPDTSRDAIRGYILDLWGTADAPDYILIIGDTDGATSTAGTIPHWSGGGSKGSPTDLPYACMDAGDDWYPDIFIGRWSCRTVSELQNIVNKSLFVENGEYPVSNYYMRGAFLANSDTQGQGEATHSWVIENCLEPAGCTGIPIYASEGGTTTDVRNAVNSGVLFTVYFGHSGSGGWWEPGFSQSDVNALTNTGLYGVACGWSCNTANYPLSECFGETWLRAANKGAAAYISASDYIYWGSVEAWQPSVELEKGFFRAMFQENIWEVGPAWQRGLFIFLENFGQWDGNLAHQPTANADICRNFFEEFVVLGDPTLLLPLGVGFNLSLDPVTRDLCSPPETQASYTIQVSRNGDFNESVTLSCTGLPSGATVDFSTSQGIPPFSSVMTIRDLDGVSAGQYEIEIDGNSSSMFRNKIAYLNITGGLPGAVALDSPPNGAVDVPRATVLAWQAGEEALSYDLQIARDAGFGNIVYSQNVVGTGHTLSSNLESATAYFWRVRGVNGCGDGDWSPAWSFMTLDQADYFTEDLSTFDLEGRTLVIYPDGSGDYYAACMEHAEDFPTDPTGHTQLSLGDDDSNHFYLSGGEAFPFYADTFTDFYINSNGNITFAGGDGTYTVSLEIHFNQLRISPLFTDMNPSQGGTVTAEQLEDRVVITFQNVPNYNMSNSNSFQIELYFDGTIRTTWLGVDASNLIVGLSPGGGIPDDYIESDLSSSNPCSWEYPPNASNAIVATDINTAVMIELQASDDGNPNPPGCLTYIIQSLPIHGALYDPAAGEIADVPYALGDYNEVEYVPDNRFFGTDQFTFVANDGGTPPDGGDSNTAVVTIGVYAPDPEIVYAATLDADPGWTTEGSWAYGQPTGGGSHAGDPDAGYTGVNVYGYNLSGDYSNNMPAYGLTTAAFDCTDWLETELSFWYWLGVERAPFDHASVEASTDGVTWTVLWENPTTTISNSVWNRMVLDLSDVADGESTVYLRWVMGTTDGGITYPGWNIDDVEIRAIVVETPCAGDLDSDGDVDIGDLAQLLSNYGMTGGAVYEDGDLDRDGDVDLSDLAALLSVYGMPCP